MSETGATNEAFLRGLAEQGPLQEVDMASDSGRSESARSSVEIDASGLEVDVSPRSDVTSSARSSVDVSARSSVDVSIGEAKTNSGGDGSDA